MLRRLTVIVAIAAWFASSGGARAEANVVRVAKQFGVAYMQYMVMQELKLIEKHAKAAGLDITTEWATFRSSDVMNDALISGSVDFVSLGIPGIITIWSKTKGTASEVKGVAGPQRVAADADGARSRTSSRSRISRRTTASRCRP